MNEHAQEHTAEQLASLEPPANAIPAAKEPMSLRNMAIIAVSASVVAVGVIGGLVWALAGEEEERPRGYWMPNCNEVEIYDPVIASGDVHGYNNEGNAKGSGVGCVPVCVLEDVDGDGQVGRGDALEFNRQVTGLTQQPFGSGTRWLLADEASVFSNDGNTGAARRVTDSIADHEFLDGIIEIMVAPSQTHCEAYDATGDIVELLAPPSPNNSESGLLE